MTILSHAALGATQRPVAAAGPSAREAPTDSRPLLTVVRAAVPNLVLLVNQPTNARITPSQSMTC